MAPHIYVLHNKKQTPFNLIGSMMIIRVYQSIFHHAMRGDTLSHSIETIYDLWWSFGLTHPCSTTLWAPDHSTSIIMRQCKDKGHISHPQEKPQSTSTGGRGGRGSRWVHYIGGGWGGGLPNLDHIYICNLSIYYIHMFKGSKPLFPMVMVGHLLFPQEGSKAPQSFTFIPFCSIPVCPH